MSKCFLCSNSVKRKMRKSEAIAGFMPINKEMSRSTTEIFYSPEILLHLFPFTECRLIETNIKRWAQTPVINVWGTATSSRSRHWNSVLSVISEHFPISTAYLWFLTFPCMSETWLIYDFLAKEGKRKWEPAVESPRLRFAQTTKQSDCLRVKQSSAHLDADGLQRA